MRAHEKQIRCAATWKNELAGSRIGIHCNMLTPFERGVIANLIADWLLQNDWMAKNKASLRHPAAWTHAAIHVVLLTVALGWQAGLALGAFHLFVDTRKLLNWWQKAFGQTTDGPISLMLKVWADQVIHVVAIALWLEMASRLGL